jgi:hypothetical protein
MFPFFRYCFLYIHPHESTKFPFKSVVIFFKTKDFKFPREGKTLSIKQTSRMCRFVPCKLIRSVIYMISD